ncbi:MAG: MBL fold metallo-hydrolase [bacterium]|nr:MBL fold metallo-hydrolase [bacterium]
MKLTFYGGAGQVTGANYLLDFGDKKIIVECGLNQGSKFAEGQNYADFKYDPAKIDVICLTHSHMDHVGRVPKLYKDGFRGQILGTKATVDLMAAALPNSLSLIKDEAKQDGHEPLYGQEDVDGAIALSRGLAYHELVDIGNGISIQLHDAGHILGSSIIEIRWHENDALKRIYFSGDLGNPPTPFLKSTEFIRNADYIVVESAYGDRIHEDKGLRKEKLENVIENTVKDGGVLMIPSFAMERTQELLFELNELIDNKRIPKIPVFVDSPLAIKITEVYKKHDDLFNKEAAYLASSGDDIFNFPGLSLTKTTAQSKEINATPNPKIIIAGSGMSQGGRILHHERRYLPDPKSTILFIGYQVNGSLGRRILEGDKKVRIFGETIEVKCKVEAIGGYSAHADQPALLKWIKGAKSYLENNASCEFDNHVIKPDGAVNHKLKKVFIVQGEKEASETLAGIIRDDIAIEAIVPEEGNTFEL